MAEQPNLTERDYEQLSAYLDGMLTDSERIQLEGRLEQEPTLRQELDALRETVALVKSLPQLKAPRNFTLTPAMVAQPTETPRTQPKVAPAPPKVAPFPIVSLMSAVAAFVLIALGIVLFVGGGDDAATMQSSVAFTSEDRAADEAEESSLDDPQVVAPPASVQLTSSPANERESTTLSDEAGAAPEAPPPASIQTTQMAGAEIQQENVLATAEARASDLDALAVAASPSPMLNQQTIPQTATALSNLQMQPTPMPTQNITTDDADDGAMPEADFAEEAMAAEAPAADAAFGLDAEATEELEADVMPEAIPQSGGGPGGAGQAAAAPTGTVIARFASTPSPTPTATATMTSSPQPTATASPTPLPTATPESTVAEAQPESPPQEQADGADVTEEAPTQSVETTASEDQTLSLILIVLGLIALGFSILTFMRSRGQRANP